MNSFLDNMLKDDLAQLLMTTLQPFAKRPIYLALSGGMDSMLMLHVLSQLPVLKSRLTAIHVNHGLSKSADAWQEQCQQACDKLSVSLIAKCVVVNVAGRGIEAAARQARYAVFDQELPRDGVLLMAHHASDQAETLMLRLLRGSGLAGLGAMHERRALTQAPEDQRVLLRPWLRVSRSTVLTNASSLIGFTWVDDDSNSDERFDRNWIRHSILPNLKERHPALESRLNATAQRLQSDYRLLQQLILPLIETAVSSCEWPLTGAYRLSLSELDKHNHALQEHLVRYWLQLNQCAMPEGEKVWHWLQQCFSAAEDKMPECAYGEVTLQRYRQYVYVVMSEKLKQKAQPMMITLPLVDPVSWIGGEIKQEDVDVSSSHAENHEYRLLPAGQCAGMKVRTIGRPSRTLKHVWQEQGIPPWLREHWPTLVIDSETICLVNLMNGCFFKCEPIVLFRLKWQGYAIGQRLA